MDIEAIKKKRDAQTQKQSTLFSVINGSSDKLVPSFMNSEDFEFEVIN